MPRVRADTDELLDIAAKYERLLADMTDLADEAGRIYMDIGAALPGQRALLSRAGEIRRKAETIAFQLRGLCGAARFAAERRASGGIKTEPVPVGAITLR